jgi:hypothetical protein
MWFCLIGYAMFLLCECRAELFNVTSWHSWVMKASAPPLEPMLSLYTELQADNWSFALITGRSENERDVTEQNLLAAGYEGWAALILRSVASRELLLSIVVFTLVTQMQILVFTLGINFCVTVISYSRVQRGCSTEVEFFIGNLQVVGV